MPTSRRDWLAGEPFSLGLSAGFFGFYAHTGVLLALEEVDLTPKRLVGVSAGALAGGLWAAGLPAIELAHELGRLRRVDFWDPGLPIGGLLRGEKFAAKLEALLTMVGVRMVEHCRFPFAAVAHDVLGRRPVVIERGSLAFAIRASCTVPIMFRPVADEGRVLIDGGVSDRPGLTAILPSERLLLHQIPSRSPWRGLYRAGSSNPPVGRHHLVLTIPDLPRLTPFRLAGGPLALRMAREHALRWLNAPV